MARDMHYWFREGERDWEWYGEYRGTFIVDDNDRRAYGAGFIAARGW